MEGETKTTGFLGWLQAIVIGRRPKRTLARLGLLIGLAVVTVMVFSFVIFPVQITGPSMIPTFQDGQIRFINHLSYLWHEPQRGDIVGIRMSGQRLFYVKPHLMYVKRIIGLPGESVAFMRGGVYINGKLLDEPYLKSPSADWESEPRVLGPQEYYVVGDNRTMPFAYHEKGGTPRNKIVGKVIFKGES